MTRVAARTITNERRWAHRADSMNGSPAVEVEQLSYRYGSRLAVDDLTLTVEAGEIFVFLGPNGGGKTTLFRLLSTLLPIQQGRIRILGSDVATHLNAVRARLGVVFQSPSLDVQLTVSENLRCQAALYGVTGSELRRREDEMLAQLGLTDRRGERVDRLSGGLRRRVELAKGMLHRPEVLLMDEPSTGLDPAARSDLWKYLHRLRDEFGVTVTLTSHLLEEAERADRIGILNEGKLVALDSPEALRAEVGGDCITIQCERPASLAQAMRDEFGVDAREVDGQLRLEQEGGHRWIARIVDRFPDQVQSITLGKPTLEDVFINKTGHRFWQSQEQSGQ